MAGRIEPDVGAILARRQIQSATRRVLASTRGLGRSALGGAAAAEAGEGLRAEARALARAAHRSLQGIGQGDAARQALREVRASLGRLRELTVQGAAPAPGAERDGAWSREIEGLAGAAGRFTQSGRAPSGRAERAEATAAPTLDAAALERQVALGPLVVKLVSEGNAVAALGSLDAAFEALQRAEEHLDADRARSLERHAALERAERGTLRGGAPPEGGAQAEALAADVAGRLARAPRAALEAAVGTEPDVALELLAQGPVELPPLPSVDAPDAARPV